MNQDFRYGFEKFAGGFPSEMVGHLRSALSKVKAGKLLKGPEYEAKKAYDLMVSKNKRNAMKSTIQKSYGGTAEQAGKVRTVSRSRPVIGAEPTGLSAHAQQSTRNMNPGRLYRKHGIGTNVLPQNTVKN